MGRDLTCVQAYRVVTVSGFHKNFLPRVCWTLKKAGHLKFSLESYRESLNIRKKLLSHRELGPRVPEFHSASVVVNCTLHHSFRSYIIDSFFTRLTILASISQRKKEKGSLNAYFLHYIINEKHSVKKEMLRSFSFTPSLFSCLVSLLSQLHCLISQFTSLSVISICKNREMPQDASLKESNFLKN